MPPPQPTEVPPSGRRRVRGGSRGVCTDAGVDPLSGGHELPPGRAPAGAGWLPESATCPIGHLHGCQATGTEL
jgi:hypothetical protein